MLRDKHLVFEISGEPHYWLFAASETKFFLRTDETEIEFHKRTSGNVAEMVIHDRGGSVFRCVRVEGGSR